MNAFALKNAWARLSHAAGVSPPKDWRAECQRFVSASFGSRENARMNMWRTRCSGLDGFCVSCWVQCLAMAGTEGIVEEDEGLGGDVGDVAANSASCWEMSASLRRCMATASCGAMLSTGTPFARKSAA